MNSMMKKIQDVLDTQVRPLLMEHEGGVEVLSFEEGIVRVRLLGKCAGCPSARLTTEELIGQKLMSELEEVKDVVLVQEVSDDLMNMARKILNRDLKE